MGPKCCLAIILHFSSPFTFHSFDDYFIHPQNSSNSSLTFILSWWVVSFWTERKKSNQETSMLCDHLSSYYRWAVHTSMANLFTSAQKSHLLSPLKNITLAILPFLSHAIFLHVLYHFHQLTNMLISPTLKKQKSPRPTFSSGYCFIFLFLFTPKLLSKTYLNSPSQSLSFCSFIL